MTLAQRVRVIACLGFGLLAATAACAQSLPVQDQIIQHEQELAEAGAARRVSDEGLELIILGYLYRQAGAMQKALACRNEALPIEQNADNRAAQAMTQNNMGRDYSNLEEADKALEFDNQALPIWREVQDRRGEALAQMTIGWAYSAREEKEKALASELTALALARAAGDPEI
jgi:tetratricopeptide (TPR) repeat protein